MTDINKENKISKRRIVGSILKGTGIVALVILGLFFLLSILIQVPAIQTWIVSKFTNSIAKDWGKEASIERVYLKLNDGLVLANLFIQDQDNDTLAYIGELHSSLNKNILSLINNKLDVEEIVLRDAQLNLRNQEGTSETNLEEFLKHLQKKDKKEGPGKPFRLNLNNITLDNVVLSRMDDNTNTGAYYDIDYGRIKIQTIDLECRNFEFKLIEFRNPIVQVYKFEDNGSSEGLSSKRAADHTQDDLEKEYKEPLMVLVNSMQVSDGVFQLLNLTKEPTGNHAFDPANLNISDIDLDLAKLAFFDVYDWNFELKDLSFVNDQGFQLDFMRSEKITLNESEIELRGLVAKTPRSYLSNDISLKFRSFEDFKQFEDKVFVKGDFSNSKIALEELMFFIPKLKSNPFFLNNEREQLQIDGRFFGRINNFSGRNVSLWLGKNVYFNGQFDSRNLTIRDEELFNLKVERINTSMATLQQLIPGFDPPENFKRLGKLQFEGNFDGYIQDFVAYGNLKSDLGDINVNMRLDIKEGNDFAKYAGELQLTEFDMKEWSGSDDFGKVSFRASVSDGKGLTLESAYAKLDATIDSISFKGYTYNNILMDGSVDKSQFNGALQIEDENIDFNFDGSIRSIDSLPQFEFKADIKKLDLFALNISKDPFEFSGKLDINMKGKNLETITGIAEAENIVFLKNDTSYVLANVIVESKKRRNDRMLFSLNSELGEVNIEGIFDLREIPKAFKKIVFDNYPQHLERLGMERKEEFVKLQDFLFDIDLVDSRNFMELLGAKGLYLRNTVLVGKVNTLTDQFQVDINSPLISYNNYKLIMLDANIESKQNNGSFDLQVDTSFIDTKMFQPISIVTKFDQDTLNFRLQTTKIIDSIDLVTLRGAILPLNEGYEIKMYDDEWFMFDKAWHLNQGNSIYFDKEKIIIEPLIMSDGYREIIIDDISKKGIGLELKRFNFDLMNAIIQYDKIWFAGESNLKLRLKDIYQKNDWEARLNIPSFTMNSDPYGMLDLQASGFIEDKADFSISIIDGQQKFEVDGEFNKSNSTVDGDINVNDYPMKIFQYILKDGISDTQGTVDIQASISGKVDDLKLDGEALTNGTGTKVIYLGTFYTFDQQRIKISESFIDITGVKLTDTNNNTAIAVGGLHHRLFADFSLDVNISSPKFISINTSKLDNPIYYGFGQGEISVDFTGPFDSADIRVNAKTGENTKIVFPIRSLEGSIDESFIKFVNTDGSGEQTFEEEFKLSGLDFEMSLEMNDQAEVSIIFDERFNEILKGTGRGNIQVGIKRNGEFDVFGDYEIEAGEYLFTAYGLVAKPFILKRGGRLTWTGDPFNARLNIEADYKGLRAPLNVFLSEYLAAASPEVQSEARKRTNVDLTLLLGGTLYTPIINFDINFPDVQGELKSYTDSNMRTLRNTPNGINNQVVGLFVFRNFLPANNPLGNLTTNDILQSGYNTISEFFFTQISLMFTSFFEQALVEKGLLSSVDFEIGLSKNTEFNTESDAGLNPDEVEISLINRFADDRLALNLGTNFVTESPFENVGSYILGDVVFEWYITEDRKIKLKVYGIYDYDAIGSGSRKQKYGVGISYRKEFGNLVDFKKSIQKAVEDSVAPSTSSNQD